MDGAGRALALRGPSYAMAGCAWLVWVRSSWRRRPDCGWLQSFDPAARLRCSSGAPPRQTGALLA
eukprot:6770380-Lingulodinium_polyedra.AAC.1